MNGSELEYKIGWTLTIIIPLRTGLAAFGSLDFDSERSALNYKTLLDKNTRNKKKLIRHIGGRELVSKLHDDELAKATISITSCETK